MSKIDDLVQILRAARNSANKRGEVYDGWEMDIAGIVAVVTALRDEFESEMGRCLDCSASGVHDHIVEAVARAIHENSSAEDEVFGDDAMSNLYRHHACAAIKAVAEWLDGIGKHTAAAELHAASEGEAT